MREVLAAYLSLKKAMARADKAVARIARGLKIQATPEPKYKD